MALSNDARGGNRNKSWIDGAKDEARRLVVMFVYQWIVFGVLVINQNLALRERGIVVLPLGLAALNALITAKIMLILEDLRVDRGLRRQPLVVLIAYQAALFSILLVLFRFVEDIVVGLFKGRSVGASVTGLVGEGGVTSVGCFLVILFVMLFPYFTFRALSRAIGEPRVKAMLFQPSAASIDDERASPRSTLST